MGVFTEKSLVVCLPDVFLCLTTEVFESRVRSRGIF
jgi:hypothetical protein